MFRRKVINLAAPIILFFKERSLTFLLENSKLILQSIITLLAIGVGIWFIKNERHEVADIKNVLVSAQWELVLVGIGITLTYIVLQGLMYVASFASIRHRIPLWSAIILFLKRNLISVFLPAGGVSSLAFFTGELEERGIKKSQINFASSLYGFVGILSVILVAIPVFIYALFSGNLGSSEWLALSSVILLIILFYLVYHSILKEGFIYKLIIRFFPSFEVMLEDIRNNKIENKHFLITVFYSVLIEFAGIAHLYVAMMALHLEPSLFAAFLGYIVSVVFLIVSPFLRGLGAIEVSMSFLLIRLGFSKRDGRFCNSALPFF